MSTRTLFALCVPLAIIGWVGLAVTTAIMPPLMPGVAVALAFWGIAVACTAAPLFWGGGLWFGIPADIWRPARALRLGVWAGIWAVACGVLRLQDQLTSLIAVALAMILVLVETFIQQRARPHPSVRKSSR